MTMDTLKISCRNVSLSKLLKWLPISSLSHLNTNSSHFFGWVISDLDFNLCVCFLPFSAGFWLQTIISRKRKIYSINIVLVSFANHLWPSRIWLGQQEPKETSPVRPKWNNFVHLKHFQAIKSLLINKHILITKSDKASALRY